MIRTRCFRAVAAVFAIAVGLLLFACGSEEEDPRSSADVAAARDRPFAPTTREEKRAYRTTTELYRALTVAKGDGKDTARNSATICRLMSDRVRAEMITAAQAASGPGSAGGCADAVAVLLERSQRRGTLGSEGRQQIAGIDVVGQTATVTVEAPDGKTSQLSLTKQGGRWKLAAPG